MTETHTNPLAVIAAACLVFPALALGLSGFETGVVVMPLVKADPDDTEAAPAGRIRNARKLLTVGLGAPTAARKHEVLQRKGGFP